MKPCGHNAHPKCRAGVPWTRDQCRVCWLYENDVQYRRHYDSLPEPPIPDAPQTSPPDGSVRRPAAPMPCLFEGPVLEYAPCDCDLKHVRDCEIHDRCTRGPNNGRVMSCQRCPDRKVKKMIRPEDVGEQTPVEQVAEVLEGDGPGNFHKDWRAWRNVIDAHRMILEKAAARKTAYPGGFAGRGIVSCVSAKPGQSSGKTLANGYLPGGWVLVKELRRLGCTLPVTFCHLGPLEWDPVLTSLVKPLGVEVIDLREWDRKAENHMRILAGWESKIAAILAAPYEDVLFLDADNVPVKDPSFLFDHPQYQTLGAAFWPDLPPYDRKEWLPQVVWNNCGMDYCDEVDFESGQLLVNKKTCWQELMLTRHINEHSDYWYKQIFGDKSTFHLAWRKLNRSYAMPPKAAGWNGGAILQFDLAGRLLFEHCVQNKPTLDGYPHGRSCLTHPGECYEHLDELKRLWNGKLWQPDAPQPGDAALAERLTGRKFLYRRIGIGERTIRLLEDNRIGLGLARCEVGWGVIGGTLCISDLDGKPTLFATEDPDGTWRGAWVEHERCAVELQPA